MPKNWATHKNEIARLYITEGHTLKDVQSSMKLKYNFDASIRTYRMKLDEWKIRKNKSRKIPHGRTSQPNGDNGNQPDLDGNRQIRALEAEPLQVSGSLPTRREETAADEKASETYETLVRLLKNWSLDASTEQQLLAILGKEPFDIAVFECGDYRENFFDLICEHVTPYNKQIKLCKAFLMVSTDAKPTKMPSVTDFHWWCEACTEPRWEDAKKKLAMMELEAWMESDAAQLVLKSALLVIGERSLQFHKSKMEFCHRLSAAAAEHYVGSYRYHRTEYMAILRDFKERNSEAYCTYYTYLLDMLEWELEMSEWRHEGSDLDEELGDT